MLKDLKENGFGGSLIRDKFSTKHGDLVIETTVNRETNVWRGSVKDGYRTDTEHIYIFAENSHLLPKLQSVSKERTHLFNSSNHTKTTSGAPKKQETCHKTWKAY